jgi:Ca2+-binding RTX toxin-like protein
MAFPSSSEQYIIELVNRARLDPVGEAKRIGVPYDDPRWPIADAPVQPLAVDPALVDAVRTRAHKNFGGDWDPYRTADQRAREAGYEFVGEGHAWDTLVQYITYNDLARDLDFFWSTIYWGDSARFLLGAKFREIGAGHERGTFSNGYTGNVSGFSVAWDGRPAYFLTGVVYDDGPIADGRYSIGEGRGGVTVTLSGADREESSSISRDPGGYDLVLGAGNAKVVFSGDGLAAPVEATFTATGANVKIDLVNGDTLASSTSVVLGAGARNLDLLGALPTSGEGNGFDNALHGGSGANLLDGRGGNDTLTGGDRADEFVVAAGEGNDVITDFTVSGAAQDELTLVGFGFADFAALQPHVRQDGADTVIDLGAGQSLRLLSVESGSLSAENVSFDDTRRLPPESGAPIHHFYGTAAAEAFGGTLGNDYIDGRGGVDTMTGGLGDDTYVVDSKYGDTIVERSGEGVDTVISWASRYRLADNVENLALRGDYWSAGTGNGLDNRIDGSAAANLLEGGRGDDYLLGGGGDDTFVVVRGYGSDTIGDFGAGDHVQLFDTRFQSGDEAVSALRADGANVVLGIGAGQRLTFLDRTLADFAGTDFIVSNPLPPNAPAPFRLTESGGPQHWLYAADGSTESDTWSGGPGNDLMDPKGGVDRIEGGLGDDTYVVDSKYGDAVIERAGEGVDTVVCWGSRYVLAANVENLTLKGGYVHTASGNDLANLIRLSDGGDTVDAGSGDDILMAGRGTDVLAGGSGSDMFVWTETGLGADRLLDFERGEDLLDLRPLFQAIGYDGFNPVRDHRLALVERSEGTLVSIDADGAGALEPEDLVLIAGVRPGHLHVTADGLVG